MSKNKILKAFLFTNRIKIRLYQYAYILTQPEEVDRVSQSSWFLQNNYVFGSKLRLNFNKDS